MRLKGCPPIELYSGELRDGDGQQNPSTLDDSDGVRRLSGSAFQTKSNSSTVQAMFYATGFLSKPEGGLDSALYKLNYMPITLPTKPLTHKDPVFVGGR